MVVNYKYGICLGCDKDKLITNKRKQLCTICNSKSLLKASYERKKQKIEKGEIVDPKKMNDFYKAFIKDNRYHISFESGTPIRSCRAWNIHHLLEKKNYPSLAFNYDVCIYLTLQEHSEWHQLSDKSRIIKFPKSYEKYLQLKQKYNL